MLDDLEHMLPGGCPDHETLEKEHGRIDRRRYWVKDVSGPGWEGYASLHGHRQAIRIKRERHVLKDGKTSSEVSCALTSPKAEQCTPAELAALERNHWHIESRLHSARDVTCDEGRSPSRAQDPPEQAQQYRCASVCGPGAGAVRAA